MNEPVDSLEELLDNVAAIAATFESHKRYQEFYDRYADQISGFVGIWIFAREAGQVFTENLPEPDADGMVWGNYGWPESVDAYVCNIYTEALDGDGLPRECFEQCRGADEWLRQRLHFVKV